MENLLKFHELAYKVSKTDYWFQFVLVKENYFKVTWAGNLSVLHFAYRGVIGL